MTCGRMSPLDAPTAIVGGNGSVQGFDAEGEEVFWTVAGDSVALALAPPDAKAADVSSSARTTPPSASSPETRSRRR